MTKRTATCSFDRARPRAPWSLSSLARAPRDGQIDTDMTYDGHAYCFPDLRADGGFADPEQFRRHLQLAIATHFQPAWRKKDRAPADSSGLADPSAGWSFEALKEADFRPAGYGRFEWTVGGDDYVKQYMPPSVAGTSYPAQALVAEMGHAGVDLALLHRIPYLGVSNEFIADCVRLFPDRLRGLAYVEEWRVRPDTDWAIKKLERAVDQLGLVGLQFLPDHLSLCGQSEEWDVREFKPYWDARASLSIPLFITPSYSSIATGESALEGFLRQLRTIRGWMETYPDVDVVLTHWAELENVHRRANRSAAGQGVRRGADRQPTVPRTGDVPDLSGRDLGISDAAGASRDGDSCRSGRGRPAHLGD